MYNSKSNESGDHEEDNAATHHVDNPMDDISIAILSIASEHEDDTGTNAAPHHCMPTLRDASGILLDTLDTIQEDIAQERITRRYVKKAFQAARAPVGRVSKNDTSSTQHAEVPAANSAGDMITIIDPLPISL